jgi:hypothetical protein
LSLGGRKSAMPDMDSKSGKTGMNGRICTKCGSGVLTKLCLRKPSGNDVCVGNSALCESLQKFVKKKMSL